MCVIVDKVKEDIPTVSKPKQESVMEAPPSDEKGTAGGYLTVAEVAKILRSSRYTILKYVHSKKLSGIQISGRKILIPRTSLISFLKKSEL